MNPADDRYIVNGAFEAVRLQELLDGFIKKFVLCVECGNPETKLVRIHQRSDHPPETWLLQILQ
jgi:translation initiation factor 2 beta subunit (eIF-2beta)/eIF-5